MFDNFRIYCRSGRLVAEVVEIDSFLAKVYGVKANCAHDSELGLAEMYPKDVLPNSQMWGSFGERDRFSLGSRKR